MAEMRCDATLEHPPCIRAAVRQVARRMTSCAAQLADLHASFASLRVDASGRLLRLDRAEAPPDTAPR